MVLKSWLLQLLHQLYEVGHMGMATERYRIGTYAVDLAVLHLLLFYMCHTVFEQKYPDFIEFFGLSKNAIKDTTRWPMSVLFVGVTLFP